MTRPLGMKGKRVGRALHWLYFLLSFSFVFTSLFLCSFLCLYITFFSLFFPLSLHHFFFVLSFVFPFCLADRVAGDDPQWFGTGTRSCKSLPLSVWAAVSHGHGTSGRM